MCQHGEDFYQCEDCYEVDEQAEDCESNEENDESESEEGNREQSWPYGIPVESYSVSGQ